MKKQTLILLGCCVSLIQCKPNGNNASSTAVNSTAISTSSASKETAYQFSRKKASTVNFGGQTARLKQVMALSKSLVNTEMTLETLQSQFSKGTGFLDSSIDNPKKKIRNKVAASSVIKKEQEYFQELFDGYLKAQTKTVFAAKTKNAWKGEAGKANNRLVNEKGLEYDQAFIKGLIGALAFDQSMNGYFNKLDGNAQTPMKYRQAHHSGTLLDGKNYTKMEHHWDEAYGYVFGVDRKSDKLLNKYIHKVDKNKNFYGIAKKIKEAFLAGRQAIVDRDYNARDLHIRTLRKELSKIIAIRTIHYLEAGVRKSQQEITKGFHNLSEGYGFIISLAFVSLDGKTPLYETAQVKGFLDKLQEGNGFWDVYELEAKVREISTAIASKFDFTVEQVL